MQSLAIDIETFSSADLKKSGVYRYVEATDFNILLFAYSFNGDPVEIIDLAQGEKLPEDIIGALSDPKILKTAFNANFERTCIRKHFNILLPVQQWDCTAVKASMLGLPLNLETVAKVLKLEEQKLSSGKALIRYFTLPCKPTKVNGGRTRNLPSHNLEKWQLFKEYCIQDVVTEQTVREKIAFFNPPIFEKRLWHIDQTINDKGMLLDPSFVHNAIRMDMTYRDKLTAEAINLTGLENPNSLAQLKDWLSENSEEEITSLTKTDIPELLKQISSATVKRVLNIRQEMAKTSVKKYVAMTKGICSDARLRGLLQFYGANRTGRWAGRLVQVHNLPKNELQDLELARSIVKSGDLELLELLFGNVPDTLSQLIRTAFIAAEGNRLLVSDFSAIEARIIAWLAGEKWRLEVFETHGKIYEASASHMFKVPIESVTKGSDLRQKGKMSELALGYQGGPDAIIKIEISNKTPLEKRIPEEELPKLVAMWRQANKAIVNFWRIVNDAAITAVDTGQKITIKHGITFFVERGILFIELPSKRRLSYLRPQLRPNRFGGVSLVYEGLNQTTKQWGRQETYGGKLVENIVQAIARDCLADAILRINDAGYNIVMHVHDETVCEMPNGKGSIEEINKIMSQPISWAKGLPLKAEGYETMYYRKD
jgi:DNA polymerase